MKCIKCEIVVFILRTERKITFNAPMKLKAKYPFIIAIKIKEGVLFPSITVKNYLNTFAVKPTKTAKRNNA